ncbi:hypothetical protein QWY16_16370 [Planococcus shenhongbingii]|uniref:Uncharacterized protein n=1 Tax=Planococcus shenhongbingii TaxID=3058398 RepID=A0ABT8NBN7_9BACL|nr:MULTISPECIES: hypothetical protein [unclassified Planococcus (in: firmicutes)]MDN7244955.1 hypothetical protein [Planococcus sp. N017]WKA58055.1 hypothetical protein QWY16_16370 [Planococcus sp. N016]
MRHVWKLKYGSHTIQVEKTLSSEKLFVDGVLQDEQLGFHWSSRLFGKVQNDEGETEDIKVSIGLFLFKVQCRIFVGERLVHSTDIQWEG